MRHRSIALHATGVEPGEIDTFFRQPVCQAHIIWQHRHVRAAQAAKAVGNIVRNDFVAFPRPWVMAAVDDGAIFLFAAAASD